MIKLIALSLFWSYAAVAGLPPTSTQGSAGGGYKTTFQFNFPYIPITMSGTNASFGQIPLATGVSGSLSLANIASIANNTILSNVSGSSAVPAANSLSAILDATACSTQGSILYRNGSSAWVCLTPGTNGQFLQTQGAGANPQWAAGGGGGSGTIYSARITNNAGASGVCAVVSGSERPTGSDWISSISRPGSGQCAITVTGGIFTAAPQCWGSTISASTPGVLAWGAGAPSTTSVPTVTYDMAGGLSDLEFFVFCKADD